MITNVRDTCISVVFVWFIFCLAETVDTVCDDSTLKATHSPKYLTSPGYPIGYVRNISCRWTINARRGETVQVWVIDLDLETRVCPFCISGDRIEVTDGNSVWPNNKLGVFSKYSTDRLISRRSSLTMSFRPRSQGTKGSGFKLQYSSGVFYDDTFPIVLLLAQSKRQIFVPPSLPRNYPNRFKMEWRIKKPPSYRELYIKVLSSSLTGDCSSNYMKALDGYSDSAPSLGRWCEQETPEKYATGSYMFILLISNSSIGEGFGFTIEYGIYVEPTTPTSPTSPTSDVTTSEGKVSIGVIAGTFIGVIAFLGVAFVVSRIVCDRLKMRDLDSVHEEEGISLEDPHRQLPSSVTAPSAPMMPDTIPTVDPSVPPPTYDDVMMNNTLYSPVKNT